jgi:hypothetical protein
MWLVIVAAACVDGADATDSLELTNICRHLLCKIRFKAPMGHQEREEDIKYAEVIFIVIYMV